MRLGTRQQTLEVELLSSQLALIERGLGAAGVQFLLSDDGHFQPEEGMDDIAGEHQEVHGRSADFFLVLHGFDGHLLGQLAPLGIQGGELVEVIAQLRVAFVGLAEQVYFLGESAQQLALAHQYLAAQQVQCLDAVGAFVDRRDAAVADLLLLAPFADVTVTTEYLHAQQGHFQTGFGHECLADGSEEG